MAQGLRLCPSIARDVGSIPGWETKIPHAVCHGQTMKINKVRIVKYFLKEILTEKKPLIQSTKKVFAELLLPGRCPPRTTSPSGSTYRKASRTKSQKAGLGRRSF